MSGMFLPAVDPVERSLRGFASAHQNLVRLNVEPLFLAGKARHLNRRVGLVSGGGSGHEPLHAGFLGEGMLDAVAPGRIFASPHNRQILEASRAAAGPEGVLHIVKNYTGDRINFGIAAERLRAEGIAVERVLVDDDLATDSKETATGRRGTGATVIVEKILGAAADDGLGLKELADLGASVAAASRSLAVAAEAHTSPHTGSPAFTLAPEELEYGVGIHGERSATTIERPGFEQLIESMVTDLFNNLPGVSPEVLVFVNGLGGATALELYAVYQEVASLLGDGGLNVRGSLVGTYVPALNMNGFSITVTRLEPQWLQWWEHPTRTAAFQQSRSGN
jgi:dihydroxyacetone kinase-like protein